MNQSQEIGYRAESIALSWLKMHGYRCLDRNFSRRFGEIDLVVQHLNDPTIVFVEVRYRSNPFYGNGISSITQKKRRCLIYTCKSWLQKYANDLTPARIDIIAVGPATSETLPCQVWQQHELVWMKNAIEE